LAEIKINVNPEVHSPYKCPKCECQKMQIIHKGTKAWKCPICGLEIWDENIPTFEEFRDLLHSGTKEIMNTGYVPTKKKGKGGRSKRRKKKVFYKKYMFE
jgi:hypothetical protein